VAIQKHPLAGSRGKVMQDREGCSPQCSEIPPHLPGLPYKYRVINRDVKYQSDLPSSTAVIMSQYYYKPMCQIDNQKLDLVNYLN
jgi:hypothetical protein